MLEPKRLTKEEVLDIIGQLDNDDFIASGSSRAVYALNYNGKNCVVKIGLDSGGHAQNRVELDTYLDYGECGKLNTIHAYYSDILLIVDSVEEIDIYDISHAVEDDEYFEDDEDEPWLDDGWASYDAYYNFTHTVQETVYELNDIQGQTSDNYQLGWNSRGLLVAYDYGYIVYSQEELVGYIDGFEDVLKMAKAQVNDPALAEYFRKTNYSDKEGRWQSYCEEHNCCLDVLIYDLKWLNDVDNLYDEENSAEPEEEDLPF